MVNLSPIKLLKNNNNQKKFEKYEKNVDKKSDFVY